MSSNESAAAVLSYWFGAEYAADPKEDYDLWYGGAKETDDHIRAVFTPLLQQGELGALNTWVEQGPYDALALIVLMDQFALNAYRDQSKGYNVSAQAVPLVRESIRRGYDKAIPTFMANFFYMPLMHSENLEDQEECVRLFQSLHGETNEFAVEHRDIVKKYGRFPGRNKCHGRTNTEEEEEYLSNGGVF